MGKILYIARGFWTDSIVIYHLFLFVITGKRFTNNSVRLCLDEDLSWIYLPLTRRILRKTARLRCFPFSPFYFSRLISSRSGDERSVGSLGKKAHKISRVDHKYRQRGIQGINLYMLPSVWRQKKTEKERKNTKKKSEKLDHLHRELTSFCRDVFIKKRK